MSGITLDDVNKKYPRIFQTLGYDALLDYDEAYKPKIASTFQMAINIILTLLFMKPGQYPSIPDLGIDIESYLHEYSDDKNIPKEIINKLDEQCNRLQLSGLLYNCSFDLMDDGTNALVITVTGNEKLGYGAKSTRAIIGITYDKLQRVYSRVQYI